MPIPAQADEETEPSIRDAVLSAIDGAGGADDAEDVAGVDSGAGQDGEIGDASEASGDDAAAAAGDEGEPAASDRSRDDKGRFAKGEGQQKAPAQAKPGAVDPKAAVTPPPGEVKAVAPELRPPQSWKPAAREHWAKLPPEVQQEAHRRDREVTVALHEAAERSKRGDVFSQLIAPFEPHIRATGGDPLNFASKAMQALYTLRMGSKEERAQLAAQMYQLANVSDEEFVQAVQKGPSPQSQPAQAPVDPNAIAEQVYAHIQQRQAVQEWQTFVSTHEHADTVKGVMQALLRGGVAKDYGDAYNQAVKIHPDVAPKVAQAEAAKAATSLREATQRARTATSSVRSNPAGLKVRPQPGDTVKDDVLAAVEALSK